MVFSAPALAAKQGNCECDNIRHEKIMERTEQLLEKQRQKEIEQGLRRVKQTAGPLEFAVGETTFEAFKNRFDSNSSFTVESSPNAVTGGKTAHVEESDLGIQPAASNTFVFADNEKETLEAIYIEMGKSYYTPVLKYLKKNYKYDRLEDNFIGDRMTLLTSRDGSYVATRSLIGERHMAIIYMTIGYYFESKVHHNKLHEDDGAKEKSSIDGL